MDKINVLKETHDYWYGNFGGDKVKLIYHGNIVPPIERLNEIPLYRVSVWGNDDFGMIFDTNNENEAKELYASLSKKSFIDKDYLQSLDFNIF